MALHVQNKAAVAAVHRLARLKGKSLTAAIREAIEREYGEELNRLSPADRNKAMQELSGRP
jgi:hypothetical protein